MKKRITILLLLSLMLLTFSGCGGSSLDKLKESAKQSKLEADKSREFAYEKLKEGLKKYFVLNVERRNLSIKYKDPKGLVDEKTNKPITNMWDISAEVNNESLGNIIYIECMYNADIDDMTMMYLEDNQRRTEKRIDPKEGKVISDKFIKEKLPKVKDVSFINVTQDKEKNITKYEYSTEGGKKLFIGINNNTEKITFFELK
ncbi:hypothetical protein HAHI6034_03490 [Hathewaya histolytica]|uniref:Lipoprotein n=1 Tax=Hathewaya histolytica TaxID=1498 RepID=A0A4U9R2V0_HATHI|nr:hypothetical protein [Hathewaya histolytica]VTQ85612.1 Uncharacterised protein [Hathewaya histolytica]